ncbi:xanthine dehydrogenase family protein molybdopterin-binding subunit, partial [Chloroflexota bacterium]
MLAEKLGLDPLTVWRKNHFRAGDPAAGRKMPANTLSSEAYDELMEKGAEAIGWGKKWQGWGRPYQVMGARRRGVGMALAHQGGGSTRLPASARVQINHDGTAQVLVGSSDIGTGCKVAFAQIGAEALGLGIGDVYVERVIDTETVPYAPMTAGSIALFNSGLAIQIAATDAKKQILQIAATAHWSPDVLKEGITAPEELDIKDSMVYVKADPQRRVSVKEVVSSVLAPIVIGKAHRHGVSAIGPQVKATVVGFADVEVDTLTGRVEVLKLVLGHDSGRIINPGTSQNQVYSGALMSLGYGLMEEVVFDPATGRVLNLALADYLVPTALDAPPMQIIFSANIDPIGPFGAKGLAESPAICPHAAIANAIYNAIGVRISELPLTPEKVLRALSEVR